jgi:hypothetical protein
MFKTFSPFLLAFSFGIFLNFNSTITRASPIDAALNHIQTIQALPSAGIATDPTSLYVNEVIKLLNSIAQLYNATLTEVSTLGPEVSHFMNAIETTAQVHGAKVLEFMDAFINLYKNLDQTTPLVLPKTVEFMDAFISMKETLSQEIGPAIDSLHTAAMGLQSIGSLADNINAHPYLLAATVAGTIAAGCLLKDAAKNHIFTLDPSKSLPMKAWRGCCWIGSRIRSINPWSYFRAPELHTEHSNESVTSVELPKYPPGSTIPLLIITTPQECKEI